MNLFYSLLDKSIELNVSDIHIKADEKPRVRINGKLIPADSDPLSTADIFMGMEGYLDSAKTETFKNRGSVDGSFQYKESRLRYNLFNQSGRVSISLRILSDHILTLEELGIPPIIYKVCEYSHGLVLVSGPTGSGKSTTIAALIDRINSTQGKHIVTIEEPIEYVHESKQCLVNQREVGTDTPDFYTALVDSLRQDPDVILLGEIREINTIKTAVTAAETGHLVFATIHSEDVVGSIERLIAVFPPEEQDSIRKQLSMNLKAVVSQKLIAADGSMEENKRVPVCEIMFSNNAIANQIARGKSRLIPSSMETSQDEGMQTFDHHLVKLLTKKVLPKRQVESLLRDASSLEGRTLR